MDVDRCPGQREFRALFESPQFQTRWQLEAHLGRSFGGHAFTLPGVCIVCACAVDFTGDFEFAWRSPDGFDVPNWRECLRCPHCRMNGRQRMITRLIADAIDGNRDGGTGMVVYLMETVSPVYAWVSRNRPQATLVASEYLGPDAVPGSVVRGIRHEDAERLSLRDASVDLVVSCDVLEHVDDPERALREMRRVLKPGGRALLTFPMDLDLMHHRHRAERRDGTLHFLEPAVYHGNPLSPKGALVFTDFGWEILPEMRAAGLREPAMVVYWSYEHGYLGIQYYFETGAP